MALYYDYMCVTAVIIGYLASGLSALPKVNSPK